MEGIEEMRKEHRARIHLSKAMYRTHRTRPAFFLNLTIPVSTYSTTQYNALSFSICFNKLTKFKSIQFFAMLKNMHNQKGNLGACNNTLNPDITSSYWINLCTERINSQSAVVDWLLFCFFCLFFNIVCVEIIS